MSICKRSCQDIEAHLKTEPEPPKAPLRALAVRAQTKVFETPNANWHIAVPIKLKMMTGLRPKWSLALPNEYIVKKLQNAKMDSMAPLYRATEAFGKSGRICSTI